VVFRRNVELPLITLRFPAQERSNRVEGRHRKKEYEPPRMRHSPQQNFLEDTTKGSAVARALVTNQTHSSGMSPQGTWTMRAMALKS